MFCAGSFVLMGQKGANQEAVTGNVFSTVTDNDHYST